MKRIGIFLGDWFWSSVPYDGLVLYHYLKKTYNVDLILFKDDIRLNKKDFSGTEFRFDSNKFTKCKDLKVVDNWGGINNLTKEYDLIITSPILAPKTRGGYTKLLQSKCPVAIWDIGAVDLLTGYQQHANYFFVKGQIWKDWLIEDRGISAENIFVTGCPHYDYYLNDVGCSFANSLTSDAFNKKYSLDKSKKKLLIAPSNPKSHTEQYDKNIKLLGNIIKVAKDYNYEVLVKTYPNDYVFYENDPQYSGIYHRKRYSEPQYKNLKNKFNDITIIQSQDHHTAVRDSDLIFNMAGSSIAWDTYFTKSKSFTHHFKNQPYYKTLSYLSDKIILPDQYINYHLEDAETLESVFENGFDINKSVISSYISKEFSLKNISKAVGFILRGEVK